MQTTWSEVYNNQVFISSGNSANLTIQHICTFLRIWLQNRKTNVHLTGPQELVREKHFPLKLLKMEEWAKKTMRKQNKAVYMTQIGPNM